MSTSAIFPKVTREELYGILDRYLEALKKNDPSQVDWGSHVRYTENNVNLMVGDGVWNTITDLGDYDLRFADVKTGGVGLFGLLEETDDTSPFALRLKVEQGKVVEIETVIVRDKNEPIKFPEKRFEHKPVMNEFLHPDQRVPRERMIALADGYFNTLELNDGTILTKFHPHCNRMENGTQMTNNPNPELNPFAKLSCIEQFQLGRYRYDDRVRDRRFPLVDEERGLVLASLFIDHRGKLGEYRLTDGTVVQSHYRRPHSFYAMELFKIKDGAIEQIEANFITVPYYMPSAWD